MNLQDLSVSQLEERKKKLQQELRSLRRTQDSCGGEHSAIERMSQDLMNVDEALAAKRRA